MTQNLKIEVLTGDISIDGMVVTNLVTKEELSTAIVKKADLGADGKIPTSQLPAEIVNTAGIVDEVKLQLETSIKDAVDESNAYAESYTDNALTSKADLTSGKVPLEQLPAIDQYPQFGTALSNLSTSILTAMKQRTDQLEKTKADLGEDGKVLREQIPSYEKISGLPEQLEVMSTQTAAVSGELDEHKLQTADQVDALKENINSNSEFLIETMDGRLENYADKDAVKRGIANRYDSSLTYNSGERVVLTNGDTAKSIIDGNTNDPNSDMTGWELVFFVTPEMFKRPSDPDWTNALSKAITLANDRKGHLELDSKIYNVSSPLPRITNPMSIRGKGQRKTWIKYHRDATGTCLATQDVNFHDSGSTQTDSNSTTIDIGMEKSGVSLRGFSIVGDRSTLNTQDGLIHYGLTDNLDIDDVTIHNIKGTGWGFRKRESGSLSNTTGIRESLLGHVMVRRCGDVANNKPAVDIYTDGNDPTNGVSIARLDSIWADGECIKFENNSTVAGGTKEARFFRVLSGMVHAREKVETAPQTTPMVTIAGRWASCNFDFTELSGARNEQWAVHIHKNGIGMARNCTIGAAISGQANGVYIEHGRDIHLSGELIRVTSTTLKLNAYPNVMGNIFINGAAEDLAYSKYNIDLNGANENVLVRTNRGGPFYIARTQSTDKFSPAGGLMPNSSDGMRLALLNDDGSVASTALEVNRYTATDANEIPQISITNGINFVPRNNKFSDTNGQFFVETRGGLFCFVFQRTNAASRKAISWNTAPPVGGNWNQGDLVFSSASTFGAEIGWVCTVAGAPGTWIPIGQNANVTVTTANLQNITHAVNTVGKFNTKTVINSTDKKIYYSTGIAAAAVWISADGLTTLTPV